MTGLGAKELHHRNVQYSKKTFLFLVCVIINPSFLRRHEIGMVLAFLTSSNSLIKLHIFCNHLQTNWPIEMNFTPKCLFR